MQTEWTLRDHSQTKLIELTVIKLQPTPVTLLVAKSVYRPYLQSEIARGKSIMKRVNIWQSYNCSKKCMYIFRSQN